MLDPIITGIILSIGFLITSHKLAMFQPLGTFFLKFECSHWKGILGYSVLAILAMVLISQKVETRINRLDLLILGYGLWLCLSVIWSQNRQTTIRRLGQASITTVLAYAVARSFSFDEVVLIIVVCSALILLVATLESLKSGNFPDKQHQRFGWTAGPNKHATNCIFLIIGSTYLMVTGFLDWKISYLLVVFAGFLLALTRSRAQLWAVVLSLVVWAAILCVFGDLAQSAVVISVPALLVILTIFVIRAFVIKTATAAKESNNKVTGVVHMGRDSRDTKTLNNRTQLWSHALKKTRNRKFLGTGYAALWGSEDWKHFTNRNPDNSHNLYVEVYAESGVIGAALFSLIVCFSLYTILSLPSGANIFLFTVFICVLVHGLADSVYILRDVETLYVLVFLFSLSALTG